MEYSEDVKAKTNAWEAMLKAFERCGLKNPAELRHVADYADREAFHIIHELADAWEAQKKQNEHF